MLVRALGRLAVVCTVTAPLSAQVAGTSVDPRLARLIPPSPAPASFIADVPRLLDAGARERLDARIDAVQDSGLADIGIAIVPSIGDYQPYEFGLGIYRTWKIGRQDSLGSARRDLGVLLLVVPKEVAP